MTRRLLALLFCLILALSISSCGKAPEPVPEPVPVEVEPEPEPEPEPMPWDLFDRNKFTGLYDVEKDLAGTRPAAIVVSNIIYCLPQRGINDCDLLLEIEVEGGITRTMAFFADYRRIDQIGPVRSLRNQFLDLARPFDAVIVHVGASYFAQNAIYDYGYRTVDAMSSNNVFQDESRLYDYDWEHTWFTDAKHVSDCMDALDLRKEDEHPEPVFRFADYGTEAPVDDGWALSAHWQFSDDYDSEIQYSRNSEAYMLWQHGDLRYDELDDKPFYFQNVFLIVASRPGYYSDSTCPRYAYNEGGYGYYMYKGMYEKFTWTKDSDDSRMVFWDSEGNELTVNPGRSYVAIVNTYEAETIVIDEPPFEEEEPEAEIDHESEDNSEDTSEEATD